MAFSSWSQCCVTIPSFCRVFPSLMHKTPYPYCNFFPLPFYPSPYYHCTLVLVSDSHHPVFCPCVFIILDISYKWNHRICGFLCLAFSTYSAFKIHPQLFIASALHFFLWVSNILLYGYTTICLFIIWLTFGLFPLLVIRNIATMNIHV